MKRKILILSILFLSFLSNNVIANAIGSKAQNLANSLMHSTLTTKLNTFVKGLRGTYCSAKTVVSLTGAVSSCKTQKEQLASTFPETTNSQVTAQVAKNNQTSVTVRNDADLCQDEIDFRTKRLKHVAESLKQLNLINDGEKPPVIALSLSGGGYRAMLGAFGMYEGFNQTHNGQPSVLDTITYAACLSGSTWATFPLALGAPIEAVKEGYKTYAQGMKVNPQQRNPFVVPHSHASPLPSEGSPVAFQYKVKGANNYKSYPYPYYNEQQTLEDNTMRMFLWQQPLGLVNYFGSMIAHVVFSPFDDPIIYQAHKRPGYEIQARQQMLLSQIPNFIGDGTKFPLPIGTMVSPISSTTTKKQKTGGQPFVYAEATPYEIGFDYYSKDDLMGAYIPTWASGRTFTEKGGSFFKKHTHVESSNLAPEYSASTFLGIFGSAFAASVRDGIRIYFNINSDSSGAKGIVGKIIDYASGVRKVGSTLVPLSAAPGVDTRLFPALLPNFAKMSTSPFSGQSYWTVVDAGIGGNLPFYPLLRAGRGVDIIITFDSSDNVADGADNLIIAERLARARGIPFPKIEGTTEYANSSKKWVTVFDRYPEGEEHGPIVINLSLLDSQNGDGLDGSSVRCLNNYCKTTNFNYPPEAIDELTRLGKVIAQSAIPAIEYAIRKIAERNRVA